MIIEYLKDEPLLTIKRNQPVVYEMMKESVSNEWVKKYLGDDCFGVSKIKVPDFEMDTSCKDPNESDFANAVILFETFKNLNETQATDERLWAGLAFGKCYEYLKYRWSLDKPTKLTYRWLFYTNNRRKLFYHGLSRLWWFTKLSYDKNKNNPYELTEYLFKYPRLMNGISYRNYSNSKVIGITIIESLKDYENKGGKVNTKLIDEIFKHISLFGSVSLLDAYERNELYDKIFLKLFEI